MQPTYRPSWQRRWLIVRLTLFFCAAMTVYIVGWGADTKVNETAVLSIIGLGASVVLGYLGIAAYDDKNVMRHSLPRRREPPEPEE